MPMIGARFYTQVENCLMHNDLLENELTKVLKLHFCGSLPQECNHIELYLFVQELENGRLFKLLAKLGVINERPQ